MKVLVTGGTGVIGKGAVAALLSKGHSVRLLSRSAETDVAEWPKGVEPWAADVTSKDGLLWAADGCEAVLHIAGIAVETPDLTFEKVNVQGTRNVVAEAQRAGGVRRLVYVSSLGADRGVSEYHKSKQRAEASVRGFRGEWVVMRPGNVYGPGDEVVSLLLKMVRTLPAIPVVGGGDQRFQPIWFEDLGQALAEAVTVDDVANRTLDVAGTEITTMLDLLDRLGALTGRSPVRVPVPAMLASMGAHAASILGLGFPITETHLQMLQEENIVPPGGENALTSVFGIDPTPMKDGLLLLVDGMPESRPEDGVGPLQHKRFYADIHGSHFRARELRDVFRKRIQEVMPLEVGQENGLPQQLKKGTTFSVTLPVRGVISMRIEEIVPDRITAATVEGHPLAGVVSFLFVERGELVRFEVSTYVRAANTLDRIGMAAVGGFLQDANWRQVVTRMVEVSGGTAKDGVHAESVRLDAAEAAKIEKWVDGLVTRRLRAEKPDPGPAAAETHRPATRVRASAGAKTVADETPGASPRKTAARKTSAARGTGASANKTSARKTVARKTRTRKPPTGKVSAPRGAARTVRSPAEEAPVEAESVGSARRASGSNA